MLALLPVASVAAARAPRLDSRYARALPVGGIVRGDVNRDGAVTAADALLVLTRVVGRPVPEGSRLAPNGDVNCDGRLTASDALIILSAAVRIDVSPYCVLETLAASMLVEPDSAGVLEGDTMRLSAVARDADGAVLPAKRMKWSSSDPAVATVDSAGLVFGVAPGSAVVTAEADSVRASAEIVVEERSGTTWPFRFETDAVIVAPGREPRLEVVDANGRRVRPGELMWIVDQYTPGDAGGTITVDSTGTVRWSPLPHHAWGFRIRADWNGQRIPGIALAFVFREANDHELLVTDHWRLAVPAGWLARIATTIPDFGAALDVGWLAQKELFGLTAEEAHTHFQPNQPIGPFSSGMNDPAVCGVSSIPLRFGVDCFVFPAGPNHNEPRWFIIFHEVGHQSTIGNGIVPLFMPALCCGATYVEGDASVAAMWSSHRMMESAALSPQTRTSVRSTFDADTAFWRADLRRWEAAATPFSDDNSAFNANMWDGIHAGLIEEFGWDYLKRYVRAWRNDPVVRDLVGIHVGQSGATTVMRRATFAAASVSAAVRTDLRDRFVTRWRFPIDLALYDQLYEYWLTPMDPIEGG